MTIGLTLDARVRRNARKRGVVMLTHRQWGSKQIALYAKRLTSHPVSVKKADTLWQHITVTRDDGTLPGDFKLDMQEVERIGVERFGSGFSYNYGIDMQTGMVGQGQLLLAKGTHTVNDKGVAGYSYNQNLVARAFAWIGMPGDKISDEAKESAAQLFAAMMDEGAMTQDPDYNPHSMVAWKDCPTDAGRAAMPWILHRAHEVKKGGKTTVVREKRPEVVALRDHIGNFLDKPRRQAVKAALLTADAALKKIERKR